MTPWRDDLLAIAPRAADDPLDDAMLALSRATAAFGNALAAIAVAVALGVAARWRDLIFYAAAIGGAAVLMWLLRAGVDAERPLADPLGPGSGPGFPSAHSTIWAALVAAVVLLVPRRRAALAAAAGAVLVLAIGASRVYLGAHDPRDVLAGVALGVGWVALVAAIGRRLPTGAAP